MSKSYLQLEQEVEKLEQELSEYMIENNMTEDDIEHDEYAYKLNERIASLKGDIELLI